MAGPKILTNSRKMMNKMLEHLVPTKTQVVSSFGGLIGLIQGILAITLFVPSLFPHYDRAIKHQYQLIAGSLKFVHQYVPAKTLGVYLHYFSATITLLSCLAILDYTKLGSKIDSIGCHSLAFWNIILIALQINAGINFEVCIPGVIFTMILIGRLILINQLERSKPGTSHMKTRSASKRKTTTPKKYKI